MTASEISKCPESSDNCRYWDELTSVKAQLAELSELVRTDSLTGLFNFRHFNQAMAQEMERTSRTANSTALIMVDLDHFKSINDRFGHEVGNRALTLTGGLLKSNVRSLDIPCRYGGEEFAVILPATDLLTAAQVAERLRAVIDDTPLLVDGDDIGLTASLGLAVYSNYQQETVEQFVERADGYLYRAKQGGRNQVSFEQIEAEQSDCSVSADERAALFGMFSDDKPE